MPVYNCFLTNNDTPNPMPVVVMGGWWWLGDED